MSFIYKPDFIDARRHWEAFWHGDIIDRPCIRVVAPRDGAEPAPHPGNLQHPKDNLAAYAHSFDRWASSMHFGGDAVPFMFPNFGPDIYAAFLGADLEGFTQDIYTSWAVPFVEDWKTATPQMSHPHGYWWEEMLKYVSLAHEIGEGKFGVGVLDLHSNLDCLAAARNPQKLCFDLVDCPDDVGAALQAVRTTYAPIYDTLFEASGQGETGTSSWLPFYCEGKFAVVQCDFICMISPEHARRFLYPALEEEAQFLDRCCYHLDGPDALVHLDDILSIEQIDAVQWVPGAGNTPHIEWMDLLKRIQAAGKSLYVAATPDEVKVYHRELRPEKTFYDVTTSSQSEADALIDWLKENT